MGQGSTLLFAAILPSIARQTGKVSAAKVGPSNLPPGAVRGRVSLVLHTLGRHRPATADVATSWAASSLKLRPVNPLQLKLSVVTIYRNMGGVSTLQGRALNLAV